MSEQVNVWDQMEGESMTQYTLFLSYLHQTLPRQIKKVTREHPISAKALYKYKDVYKWFERADAYDRARGSKINEVEMARGITIADYRMQVIQQEIEDASYLREAWRGGLQKIMEDTEQSPKDFMGALSQATYIRNAIDNMMRRAVELPNNISKKLDVSVNEDQEIEPDEIRLTMNGPKFLVDGQDANSEKS